MRKQCHAPLLRSCLGCGQEARGLTLTLAYAMRAFHSGPHTLLDEHAGWGAHCYWPPTASHGRLGQVQPPSSRPGVIVTLRGRSAYVIT